MFKLIKYDIRRDILSYIILFGIMFFMEILCVISILAKSESGAVISMGLFIIFAFAGIVFIMIFAAISYARLISSKAGYMTFMTPMSPGKIMISKFITLLFSTVLASFIYVAFIYLDVRLILSNFVRIRTFVDASDYILRELGININEFFVTAGLTLLSEWLFMFSTIIMAFFAITLSATILSGKRGRGGASFGFFAAIFTVTRIIISLLPGESIFETSDVYTYAVNGWPTYVFEALIIAGGLVGTIQLLNKKVSL